jgi:hypothetical protein
MVIWDFIVIRRAGVNPAYGINLINIPACKEKEGFDEYRIC